MARGVSLNIGLNRVDPACYGGWAGTLSGCLNDAASMQGIADSMGFSSTRLSDAEATADAVIEQIGRVATQLESGDTFLVTYSGHGGQVPDENGDEEDGQDETWVLFDRMLLDDELAALWTQFAPGVRILVLSDSCHSGTVARVLITRQGGDLGGVQRRVQTGPRFRLAPAAAIRASFQLQRRLYRSLQWISGSRNRPLKDASASILLISGCQDNQLSMDGDVNGLFTEKLLIAWNGGRFQGNYRQFWQSICTQMPPEQSPNYYLTGQSDPDFEAERPFTIGDGSSTQPGSGGLPSSPPTVTGPVSCRRGDPPPTFSISRPSGTYYVFEICTRPELLDISNHGAERTASNFYGSWADAAVPSRLSSAQFQLPQPAWTALQQSGQLYFRIITTTSPSGWDGAAWSTPDHQYLSAPSVQVLAAGSMPGSEPPSEQPEQQPTSGPGPLLRLGSRGEDVRRLQTALVQRGYALSVDGDFGAKTEGAVRDFQRNHGLNADGIVGPQTWAALSRSGPNGVSASTFSYPGHD